MRFQLAILGCLASFWVVRGQAQTELILNGAFTTTPSINNYSTGVGRSGSGSTQTLDGTSGSSGWYTTASDARFEVWQSGAMGSPTGVGQTLELAANYAGATIYQDVTSQAALVANVLFSFGYSTRESGQDAFTVTVSDLTHPATLLMQAFNPTGSFSTNQTYSNNLTITPGDTYRVAFLDQNTSNSGSPGTKSAHIEQVSFIQAPEPGSLMLAGAALIGLGIFAGRSLRERGADR